VKMLTHLQMVVYTWWCWQICKGGGVSRVERGVGSSLPEKIKCIFGAFEKLSAYFLLHRWEFLEKLRECLLLRNTHQTLVLAAPDAGLERPVWCLWHRCAECTRHTQVSPVLSVRCAGGLVTLSAHESGEHRTLRMHPVAHVQ